ncbi:MAG: putative redox protein [Frankiaceae bacterium]|jgi:putative redox protein|nr:putative redox protein [Frankiaceae bacterium]
MSQLARASATNILGYRVEIRAGKHILTADEPVTNRGEDTGPSPYGLLLSGLGACTAITLRMYAERKGWPLGDVGVQLVLTVDGDEQRISRVLSLAGALDDDQRARLLDISERTPVTKTLKSGVRIHTRLEEMPSPE